MNITFPSDELERVFERVVARTLALLEQQRAELPEEIMSEQEVARYLRVKPHVVRDERLRGRLHGSKVGRYMRYRRADVLAYLLARRAGGDGGA